MFHSYWDDADDPDHDIEHYGVKGMKWGVRKKARSTGKALKKKLREEVTGKKSRPSLPGASKDYARTAKLSRRKMWQLSNNELREMKTRMELENYVSSNSKYQSTGRKIIDGLKNQSANIITSTLVATGTAVATGLIAQRYPEFAQYIPKPGGGGGKKKKK